jgi:hypothetical protein
VKIGSGNWRRRPPPPPPPPPPPYEISTASEHLSNLKHSFGCVSDYKKH